jgi:iron complex outermembrane receptor protein
MAAGNNYAQYCNTIFEGNILSVEGSAPLEAAVVEIVGTDKIVASSASGYFKIEGLCPNVIIKVKISHLNCPDYFSEIDLNKTSFKNFYLDHKIQSLDEIVIVDNILNDLSTSSRAFSLSELEKERYSDSGLAVLLEKISGVNTLSTGNKVSKPVIHGMFGSRVGILYNGVMLENQQWGQDHAPNIDINAFDRIRVIKGASVLKYSGSNPGGIIIIESKAPKTIDTLYGKTIINALSNGRGGSIISSITNSSQNGKYLKSQITVKKSGDLNSPNYLLSNTANNEKNISISGGKNFTKGNVKLFLSYFNTEIGILKSSHIGNIKDLLRAIESDTPGVINDFSYNINYPNQDNTHYTASVDYNHFFDVNKTLSFKYSFQFNNRKEYDLRIGDFKNVPALNLNLSTHNVNSNYTWSNFSSEFVSGIFFEVQDNYSTPGTGVKRLIPDYLNTKLGGYFVYNSKLSKGVNFSFGLRYQYSSNDVYKFYRNSRWENENYQDLLGKYVIKEVLSQKLIRKKVVFNTFSSNVGLVKKFREKYSLSIHHNYTERAPNIAEMFSSGLHHSLASIEYGDPFLKKERTHKVLLDFEKKNAKLNYRINPYLSYSKDYVLAQPAGFEQTIRGAFPVWEFSPINSIFKGIDIDFVYQINDNIKLKNNISWVEAKDFNSKKHLVNIPPLVVNNEIEFSSEKFKKFNAIIGNKFVNKQNLFPNNNSITSVIENGKKVDKIVDISTPPDAYNIFNLNFNWGPYNFVSSNFYLGLSIDNLTNKSYRNYLNRLRFYSDEIGRNILLQIIIKY